MSFAVQQRGSLQVTGITHRTPARAMPSMAVRSSLIAAGERQAGTTVLHSLSAPQLIIAELLTCASTRLAIPLLWRSPRTRTAATAAATTLTASSGCKQGV
jgi:hypothetical protein